MIELFGWSDVLQSAFAPFSAQGYFPGRVTAQHRALWRMATPYGDIAGRMSGRFELNAATGDHPVVGDWLALERPEGSDDAVIQALLPRHGAFTRRAAGDGGLQVVAANVDVAFLVAALNGDLNLRRLERYLVATRDSGAQPVIVLTKADLIAEPDVEAARIVAIAGGAAVVALSALTGAGLEALDPWLRPGVTSVLLGSSGAGKSTLLNALANEALMDTGDIRESDDRGRHTTRHRELFRLPCGALLIDTPGMRELGLLAVEEALDASFEDVTDLMQACRFSNCTHVSEPGCAVLSAKASGELSEARWEGYLKLQRELEFAASRENPNVDSKRKQRWKQIHKDSRAQKKHRNRNSDL